MNDNRPEFNKENGDVLPGSDLPETDEASEAPDPSEEEEAKIPMPEAVQNGAAKHRKVKEQKSRCLKRSKTVRQSIG